MMLRQRWRLNIAFHEITQECESRRLQLQQANRWADQAQRDKISLYGEMELKNIREHQAKDCQEIQELRRICCEETLRARQARIDELSKHQERNPTAVSQLFQLLDLQHKVNTLSDTKEFYDPEPGSSSGADPTFPVNPPLFRVPGSCLAAILNWRTIHGILWVIQETFQNDYLLEKDGFCSLQRFQEFGNLFSRIET